MPTTISRLVRQEGAVRARTFTMPSQPRGEAFAFTSGGFYRGILRPNAELSPVLP